MLFFSDKSITSFAAKNREKIVAVIGLDQIMTTSQEPHSAIFEIDFKTAKEITFLSLAIVGATFNPLGSQSLVTVDEWGEVRIFKDSNIFEERFEPSRGPIRQVRAIGGQVFAVGAAAQAFRRDTSGRWHDFGPNPDKIGDHRLSIFSDIDCFSADDVYVAGTQGTIWHVDCGNWIPVHCATNLSFHAIHCASDGQVYACGQAGIVAVGRGQQFKLISPVHHPLTDLWGLSLYQDTLFFAAMRALLELGDDGLEPCLPAMDLGNTFYGLDQADGVLWAVGEKDILRYDGSTWEAAEELEWMV